MTGSQSFSGKPFNTNDIRTAQGLGFEPASTFNVVIELNSLFYRRPGPGATDEEVAAWYEAKGRLYERLAELGGPEAAQERQNAMASYDHARRLNNGGLAAS